jgi:hypothetical protein
MSKTKDLQAKKIVELERQLHEAKAGSAHVYHFADKGLDKAGTKYLTLSGVVVPMTVLGGRELFAPVLIRDGLSDELIAALRADLARSYELAVMCKPSGLKKGEPT